MSRQTNWSDWGTKLATLQEAPLCCHVMWWLAVAYWGEGGRLFLKSWFSPVYFYRDWRRCLVRKNADECAIISLVGLVWLFLPSLVLFFLPSWVRQWMNRLPLRLNIGRENFFVPVSGGTDNGIEHKLRKSRWMWLISLFLKLVIYSKPPLLPK